MKIEHALAVATLLALQAILVSAGLSRNSTTGLSAAPAASPALDGLQEFARLNPIDTHAHVFKNDPAFVAFMARTHLHIVEILVVDRQESYHKGLQPQLDDTLAVVRGSEGHAVLCTTFDPYKFEEPGFDAQAVRQLDRNFAEGAVAVKIWKNLGMELRNHAGKFAMADDPIFEADLSGYCRAPQNPDRASGGAGCVLAAARPCQPRLQLLPRASVILRVRASGIPLQTGNSRRARPHSGAKSQAARGGGAPGKHGNGRGPDRRALRPLS